MEAMRKGAPEGYMSLDDFTVQRGVCNPVGSCDFENGLCGWMTNSDQSGNTWLWLRADVSSNSVVTDHTTESGIGESLHYIDIYLN